MSAVLSAGAGTLRNKLREHPAIAISIFAVLFAILCGLGLVLSIGVSIPPGCTELARIPNRPSSSAATLVMPCTANLLAA